jgi:hypothetical protein
MFDNVYDNGEIVLGKVIWVKKYIRENADDITEVEDILKDLEELYINDIVAIHYDHGMGYSIDYWTYNDIVDKP